MLKDIIIGKRLIGYIGSVEIFVGGSKIFFMARSLNFVLLKINDKLILPSFIRSFNRIDKKRLPLFDIHFRL